MTAEISVITCGTKGDSDIANLHPSPVDDSIVTPEQEHKPDCARHPLQEALYVPAIYLFLPPDSQPDRRQLYRR